MRLVLIGDTFPPLRTSGAVQLRDLTREFVAQGHAMTVLLPDATLTAPYQISDYDGAQVVRLKAPQTKDVSMVRRTLAEWAMPYAMGRALRQSPLKDHVWDGIIWYSPPIFHTPLVAILKRRLGCKAYLIIRDIFPQWALDMGLMKPGPVYRVFDWVAQRQFQVADVIGVQTPGNLSYFDPAKLPNTTRLDVLQNWIGPAATTPSPIRIEDTPLKGRKIMVYAGNMGVAQSMDVILDLATLMRDREDLGFVFVGRGSDAQRLAQMAQDRSLTNTLFFGEIDPDAIPDLYNQCFGGIVSLDHRHKSHNIPGKFLTYMQSGLPVFAKINPGNDLEHVIHNAKVGLASDGQTADALRQGFEQFIDQVSQDTTIAARCHRLVEQEFSVQFAVQKIVANLQA